VSIHDAIEFLVRASDDTELSDAVAAMDGRALVQRAQQMGLSFTAGELEAVASSPDTDPESAVRELSDDDLDGVSGGGKMGSIGGGTDVSALALWALKESYQQTNVDLHSFASKVKQFNSTKKSIRDSLS